MNHDCIMIVECPFWGGGKRGITENVTGLQVVSWLVLRIGLVLFLALFIVELIILAQVCVCVPARALIHMKNDMKSDMTHSVRLFVLSLQILYSAVHVECCAPW